MVIKQILSKQDMNETWRDNSGKTSGNQNACPIISLKVYPFLKLSKPFTEKNISIVVIE